MLILAPIAPIAPATDDDRSLDPSRAPVAPDDGEGDATTPRPTEVDHDIAERLASYGESQFRNRGGQGRARALDWERSRPAEAMQDDDERVTVVPYSDYSPVEK